MKFIGAIAVLILALLVFSGSNHGATAQVQSPASPVGRYQVYTSTASAQAVILLDTQLGRSWVLCDTKPDSSISRRTVVDNNWCAMQVIGTAQRP